MARGAHRTDWKGVREAREARLRNDVDALIRLLARDDQDVRDTAARSLGLLGDPKAVPVLLAQLSSGDHGFRVLVVKALGRIGDASAARELRHLADLTTTPIGIKTEALLACLRCGDRSAAAELAAFLTDSDLLERELRRQPIFPRASVRSTKRWVRRVLVSEHATEALPVLTEAVALSSGIERWRLNRLTRQLHAS